MGLIVVLAKRVRPKVLIVDDDVPTVTALKRLLKPTFDCEGVNDSEEALRVIHDGVFDLAVVDVELPRIDGFALLERYKQLRPQLPVVMLSGDARPNTIIGAMRRGACDFVVKPFEDARGLPARLMSAVTRALSPRAITELLLVLEDSKKPLPRYSEARQSVLHEFQRSYLERLMREAGGNLSAASRLSGIDRANLRRALQKFKR